MDWCAEVIDVYRIPSPFLMTIVADGTIHNIFEDATEENDVVAVKEPTINVKMEEHTMKKESVQGDTTHCEAANSGATLTQQNNVNVEAKSTALTLHSCQTCFKENVYNLEH